MSDKIERRDGRIAADKYFYAEQNARLVKNAEEYYRSMFGARAASWNLRDTHMADTLDALVQHLGRYGESPKIVLWAHNSHLGDARATEMSSRDEVNVGQLVRERHGLSAFLVGFTTNSGTVTAASDDLKPNARAITSTRSCRNSSMPCCISTRAVPSSHWSLLMNGIVAKKRRKHFPSVCECRSDKGEERCFRRSAVACA